MTAAAAVTAADIERAMADIVGDRYVSSAEPSRPQTGAPGGAGGGGAGGREAGADAAPAWTVRPGSAAEVAELVRLAARAHMCVIPVGNATRPPNVSALAGRTRCFIDARRMNHVLHLDETSLIVHVQAGLSALELERVLAPRRLSLGDYPPSALGSTIGGMLSVRTPGKSSARHGFVEDAVLGVSAVLADGRSVHTRVAPRRATGPDLARALCGSEGTLGIITSAVLRIHRVPEARFLSAHALPDFGAAMAAVNLALREEAAPSALRVYDATESRAHLGDDVCTTIGQPDAAVLVAATAGPTDLAACDRDLIASVAQAMGGEPLPDSVAETWWQRRTGRDPGAAPPAPAFQVTAAPAVQAGVYRAVVDAAVSAGGAARAHASRFGADGAVLFFSLSDPAGAPVADDDLARIRAAAEAAAARAGAVLLGATNAALDPYLVELRRQLDPSGIMNPGALSDVR